MFAGQVIPPTAWPANFFALMRRLCPTYFYAPLLNNLAQNPGYFGTGKLVCGKNKSR